MKSTKITDKEASAHGYFAYACGRGKERYALHVRVADGQSKLVKTFTRKCDALAHAMSLPKGFTLA